MKRLRDLWNDTPAKVRFHRARAVAWAVFGLVSFVTGLANNIALVWMASVYANVVSDWGAGEAADDRATTEKLDRLEANDARIEGKLDELLGTGRRQRAGGTPRPKGQRRRRRR